MEFQKILVVGGAGFVGSNIANYYLEQGKEVVIFDNFSRKGSKKNAEWLKRNPNAAIIKGDVTRNEPIKNVIPDMDAVFHMAAQVAVTSSVENPRKDFKVNALGTFNVLEDIRKYGSNPALLFASTNKVYGNMEDVIIAEQEKKYAYKELQFGISESRHLDFHSPYGCSKGAADQYVRDYQRIYGMNNVIFRKSCIYGNRQFGTEDQGWVAWFALASLTGRPITVYGDGKQVRDVLYIDDLVRAYDTAAQNAKRIRGQIYNIGGGPSNTLSILQLIEILERKLGKKISFSLSGWRPGDQKVCIMDIRKAKNDFGWEPRIGVEEGINKLIEWIKEIQ